MHLVVGLGNPGKEYEKTRHNVGFLCIDQMLQQWHLPDLKVKKEFEGAYVKTVIEQEDVILLKPLTYMNLSGNAVSKVMTYYKIPKENLIVIHDDIDLPLGKIRIVQDSSSGGQKGVQSIIDHLGRNFIRIKIGITEGEKQEAVAHVLSPFNKKEWARLEESLEKIPTIIETILRQGVEKAQNVFN
jgi:PTH1 family peptidyl-tRNA hydrolase